MRVLALIALCLAAACTAGGPVGFGTEAAPVTSYGVPGTDMTNVTLKGDVIGGVASDPSLTVALITPSRTIAATKIQNKSYSLALPPQAGYENEKVSGFHDIWELVLFLDRNGNGTFDKTVAPDKVIERDVPLPTIEYYRMAYKGYTSSKDSFAFLPRNDFQKGWVLVRRRAAQPTQYHQNFALKYDLTDSASYENANFAR